jgi:mannose-1-phosphate guanylyltransferase
MLKGLILAGGFATRLRPLSCSKPKLLFPLIGTPLIDHMIHWMNQGNVGQVILAVNHLSDKLRIEIARRKLSDSVLLSVEQMPLGTGGPIKLASPNLDHRDPLIVANGDVVSNIDLKEILAAHKRSGAEATIALVSVPDRRAFGTATTDEHDRIVRFEEKLTGPATPGWINAGVYVLNPSVVEMIPSGRPVSLEREIFPLLANKMKLQAYRYQGIWHDIGTIQDYVAVNRDLLDHPQSVGLGLHGLPRSATIEFPSYVAGNCVLATDAKIGPYGILSDYVNVRSKAIVRESIVFEDTTIGEHCNVEGSIIGESVTVGNRVRIGRGSLIAGQVSIPDGTVLNPGSLVLN